MKRMIGLAMVSLMVGSLSAKEQPVKNDTLVVTTTPQMHCANCEKKIKQHVRFVKGVKRIDTSLSKQTVTIIYDKSKATYADFVKEFKKIGYEIKQ